MKTRRQHILDAVTDMVADFMYYDRKEDEDLPLESIEEAVELGEISVQEIIDAFASDLKQNFR
mgnify:FL=1